MQRGLGVADGQRPWNVTAYVPAFGSPLLLGGRRCALFDRENTVVIGLVGFAMSGVFLFLTCCLSQTLLVAGGVVNRHGVRRDRIAAAAAT